MNIPGSRLPVYQGVPNLNIDSSFYCIMPPWQIRPKHATWNLCDSAWGQTKNEIQFCQNSPGGTVGEPSHFSSQPAFLRQKRTPRAPLPIAPASHQKRGLRETKTTKINYSETTCVVRRGIICRTEPECWDFWDFIVRTRGKG